ncbi:hypothetical protein [Flavonifractor sp. An306]|uniref:hypothetical protein n=1 Tax=Flavonifractor sp. An306 TaxID=1965629 RepID=UPI000B4452AB|nr:hypothetical protein [Flavonifractor sp. An306]OUO26212.1 hypothetical protein B5F88_19235 [Flavonifractor sp. An306]
MAYKVKAQITVSIEDDKSGKVLLWDDTNTIAVVDGAGFYVLKSGLSNHLYSLAGMIDDLGGTNI